MFYISPYVKGGLPVYGTIQEWVPYPMNLVIYIAGFTLGSGIVLWVMKFWTGKNNRCEKAEQKKEKCKKESRNECMKRNDRQKKEQAYEYLSCR